MYKMVVCGFNNTIVNNDESISCSTMLEIERIRNMGVKFTIASENGFRIIYDYNKDFPFIDYIVSFNGAYVYDVKNCIKLYDKTLSISNIKKLYKLFNCYDLCFYTLDKSYYTGNYHELDYSYKIDNFNEFIKNNSNIYKMLICCNNVHDYNSVIEVINNQNIKVYINKYECNNLYFIEVGNIFVNKYNGLLKVMKDCKIKNKDVLCITSADTDICLVENIDKVICLDNGSCNLKCVCKEHSCSNEKKGVEKIIKKYFV